MIAAVIGVDLTSGSSLTSLAVPALGAIVVVALYRLVMRRSLGRR